MDGGGPWEEGVWRGGLPRSSRRLGEGLARLWNGRVAESPHTLASRLSVALRHRRKGPGPQFSNVCRLVASTAYSSKAFPRNGSANAVNCAIVDTLLRSL